MQQFKANGVTLATTPNYSLLADVPRHDNMHALKRIASTWAQVHDAGIPTALHINGRTPRDFERLAGFLRVHDEISTVAFEYTTGPASRERGEYFTDRLLRFADAAGRPLSIILRGGLLFVPELEKNYRTVVLLDTVACMKTIKRQRAVTLPDGRLRWIANPTPTGAGLDALLEHNMISVMRSVQRKRHVRTTTNAFAAERRSKKQRHTHDKAPQLSLLDNV